VQKLLFISPGTREEKVSLQYSDTSGPHPVGEVGRGGALTYVRAFMIKAMYLS